MRSFFAPAAERLRFDAASAECVVYTYADGLLAAIAHDLAIRVDRFTLEVDEATAAIVARFDAASLHVLGAMRVGAHAPEPLAERDHQEIERTIAGLVLAAERHPEIRFESSSVTAIGGDLRIEGALTIRERTRLITASARLDGGRLVAEAVVHTPDFGIEPFTAVFGTLRVKADVRVRLTIPRPR